MTKSSKHDQPSGNPTLWTVAALRWALESPEHELAIGQEIESVEVPDRELAVAIAHHLLDKHAHEAFGKTGLEIHIVPPVQMPSDQEPAGFRHYKVSAEARKQAQTLGIRGDVETRVARMARHAARFTHPIANLRYQRFIMRAEKDTITWIGIKDADSRDEANEESRACYPFERPLSRLRGMVVAGEALFVAPGLEASGRRM